VQIPVGRKLYDQFFNGRHGYRAHYWVEPDVGNDFDSDLVRLLREAIRDHMPPMVDGRRIDVRIEKNCREEWDVGSCSISRDFALKSLMPDASKVWRCEWLIRGVSGLLQWRGIGHESLRIEKWKASDAGLLAPTGEWLDFKGGFVDDRGRAIPSKDRIVRAKQLHTTGTT
jgi:hypothetical protein